MWSWTLQENTIILNPEVVEGKAGTYLIGSMTNAIGEVNKVFNTLAPAHSYYTEITFHPNYRSDDCWFETKIISDFIKKLIEKGETIVLFAEISYFPEEQINKWKDKKNPVEIIVREERTYVVLSYDDIKAEDKFSDQNGKFVWAINWLRSDFDIYVDHGKYGWIYNGLIFCKVKSVIGYQNVLPLNLE